MVEGIILAIVISAVAVLFVWWIRKKEYGRTAQYIVAIVGALGVIVTVYENIISDGDANFDLEQQGNNNVAVNGDYFENAGGNIYGDVFGNVIYNYGGDNGMVSKSDTNEIQSVDEWLVGWGDSFGGRAEYTAQEVRDGRLGNKITFNSIKDGVIGHEFNFVAARKNYQNPTPENNEWYANEIQVEEGETYRVRLYVHNNSPLGMRAVAEDVSVKLLTSDPVHVLTNDLSLDGFDSSNGYHGVSVHGFIDSSNAEPSSYWDGVKFVSNRPFKLKYVPGTALLENNGIGSSQKGAYILNDAIATEKGVPIGYDAINGNIPGCDQYSAYVSIVVMPVFYE